MGTYKMRQLALAVGVMAGSILGSSISQGATFDQAFNAAWNGPEIKKASLYNHEWNIKKATVTRHANHTVLAGQISHHRRLRNDHQVYYNLSYRLDGTLYSAQVFQGGQWKVLDRAITDVLGGYFGRRPIDYRAQKQLSDAIIAINRIPQWEGAAQLIVAHIAIRAGAVMVNTPDTVLTKLMWSALSGPSHRNRIYGQEMTTHKASRQVFSELITFHGAINLHGSTTLNAYYQIDLYQGHLSVVKLGVKYANGLQYTQLTPALVSLLQPYFNGRTMSSNERRDLRARINNSAAPALHKLVAQIAIHAK